MSNNTSAADLYGGDPAWVQTHREVWRKKAVLRYYYENEIFRRVAHWIVPGRTLELGSGPGFMRQAIPDVVRSDINPIANIDVCFDVHKIPFPDETFENVIGVDILHHFARPGLALKEIARVLAPGGRLVLIEPWTGPIGTIFYRYIHHEDCETLDEPWDNAFPGDKDAMQGNTKIPKTVLWDRVDELENHVPGLRQLHVEPFGFLSFLLTGGFQTWGFPTGLIKTLATMENHMPAWTMSVFATRALFVYEKRV